MTELHLRWALLVCWAVMALTVLFQTTVPAQQAQRQETALDTLWTVESYSSTQLIAEK